jgi:hypothetical protein
MRQFLLLTIVFALLLCCSAPLSAQIPNPGFETWIPSLSVPTGWASGSNVPGYYTTVTQSTTAHSGSSSARGEVVAFMTNPVPPSLITVPGFPWTQRSATLTGWYQFFPAAGSGDSMYVIVILYKGQLTSQTATGGVGLGSSSSWKQFTLPIYHPSANQPDAGQITISIGGRGGANAAPHLGSYFLVDDLAFSGSVPISAVETPGVPNAFALEQNYPNPFNPSTNIRFSVAEAGHVSLKAYNVLGVEVASIVNERKNAGTFNVNWNAAGLPSGMYLYRLSVTSEKGQMFDQAKKLVLVK